MTTSEEVGGSGCRDFFIVIVLIWSDCVWSNMHTVTKTRTARGGCVSSEGNEAPAPPARPERNGTLLPKRNGTERNGNPTLRATLRQS
eukprot:3118161-Prymnesium_polylepis.1